MPAPRWLNSIVSFGLMRDYNLLLYTLFLTLVGSDCAIPPCDATLDIIQKYCNFNVVNPAFYDLTPALCPTSSANSFVLALQQFVDIVYSSTPSGPDAVSISIAKSVALRSIISLLDPEDALVVQGGTLGDRWYYYLERWTGYLCGGLQAHDVTSSVCAIGEFYPQSTVLCRF